MCLVDLWWFLSGLVSTVWTSWSLKADPHDLIRLYAALVHVLTTAAYLWVILTKRDFLENTRINTFPFIL